jgi:hypothetical protein
MEVQNREDHIARILEFVELLTMTASMSTARARSHSSKVSEWREDITVSTHRVTRDKSMAMGHCVVGQ